MRLAPLDDTLMLHKRAENTDKMGVFSSQRDKEKLNIEETKIPKNPVFLGVSSFLA